MAKSTYILNPGDGRDIVRCDSATEAYAKVEIARKLDPLAVVYAYSSESSRLTVESGRHGRWRVYSPRTGTWYDQPRADIPIKVLEAVKGPVPFTSGRAKKAHGSEDE